MESIARGAARGKSLRLEPAALGNRDDAARLRVPQYVAHGLGNLGQPEAPDVREQVPVFVVTLGEAIVRNPGGHVVDVMVGDVGGKPVQPAWQVQEAGTPYCGFVAIPAVVIARVGVLEIMLHREDENRRPAGY